MYSIQDKKIVVLALKYSVSVKTVKDAMTTVYNALGYRSFALVEQALKAAAELKE